MATHPSVLAWRIPGTGSLVGCRLWGHTESDMTEATQQQQQHSDWCEVISHCSFDLHSWVFFGRNDAKAETPVLWPPHAKS